LVFAPSSPILTNYFLPLSEALYISKESGLGVVFAFLASIMMFIQFSPVLSAGIIALIHQRAIKSKFKFFVFLTLIGLGLFSLVSILFTFSFSVYTMLGNSIDLSSIQSFFVIAPISAILAIIFQLKVVKHWKVYEEKNV